MEKLAIYGKGGIGKSVVATNLSARYALSGKRVLHVGCDPKHDSSVKLMNGTAVTTVMASLGRRNGNRNPSSIVNRGKFDIHCIESGGPAPGVGCGGRGVARAIEIIDDSGLLDPASYDVAIFDVLGDVVCGGFAAPLRSGMARKVLIVVSEEPMALYAANNIAKAVITYAPNGVVLGGLIANIRTDPDQAPFVEAFAARLNTRILSYIQRDALIIAAEKKQMTVMEYARDSKVTDIFRSLADTVYDLDPGGVAPPTPMSDDDFFTFIRG